MRGIEPSTHISWAQISATSCRPSCRAASAGATAVRSLVAVKTTLTTSAGFRSLLSRTWATSSRVEARIASRSSTSTRVAPRTARTATSTSDSHGSATAAPSFPA